MSEAPSPPPDDARTQWLLRYQAWLKLLARLEIDRRFQGKFSESDAVQQTLFEAWRCWERFQGDDEPARLAWLRQILAHQLAHLARHYGATQKRDARREQSLDQTLAQSAHRLGAFLAADQSTPSAIVLRDEQQLQLAKALDNLPADYREVLVLRNLEELSHDDIAARMGRSVGAVRMLWLRALAALREEFLRNATSTESA